MADGVTNDGPLAKREGPQAVAPPVNEADGPGPPAASATRPAKVEDPAFYKRRKGRDPQLICQILIRNGDLDAKHVRKALKLQEERGGQIGRILVRSGACTEAALARGLLQQLRMRAGDGRINSSVAARANPAFAGLKVPCSPFLTTLSLVLTDAVALLIGVLVGQLVHFLISGEYRIGGLLLVLPAIAFCLAAFWFFGLYDAMAQSPPDELRNMTATITLMYLCAEAVTLLHGFRGSHVWPFAWIASSWATSLAVLPLARAALRARCAHKPWWGHPVVVLGAAKTGRLLVRVLRAQPRCGLKPVLMLDDDRAKHGTLRASLNEDTVEVRSTTQASNELVTASLRAMTDSLLNDSARVLSQDLVGDMPPPNSSLRSPVERAASVATKSDPVRSERPERPRGMFAEVEKIPVVGKLELAPVLAKRLKIPYAIVAMPGLSSEKLLQLAERVGGVFSHLLIIPDLFGFASLGVPARDVGGILGIEVRQQLLLPGPRLAKRIMDVVLTGLGGLCILPIFAILTLLIVLDSKGSPFYFQERLGQDGRRFRAYKFRSMHGDGEARLKSVLESDPKLRAEYEEFHKLSRDPRVTRVGRVLRKFSMDELPQLYNVLRGDMSLVGPRPYLEREIPDMEQREKIILRAPPGLTGLWQVSDRNSTGFEFRIRTDVHYVRNWSPWLDIYVLARTFGVVIKGTGS
jgi:lipopolysaccharide/colanic/teichoic acid biosynthesis glycosyltransferase